MLRRLLPLVVAVVAALAVAAGGTISAFADGGGGVTCPPDQPVCIIQVGDPGGTPSPTPSSTHGGGGTPECRLPGTDSAVACYDPTFGWWSNSQGCYFRAVDPQPPSSDPAWSGHYPNGTVYLATCLGGGGSGGGWLWLPNPPDGYGGSVSPATLAQRALDSMRLDGPEIGMAPAPGKTGLVGLPVWLWTQVTPSTWGPLAGSASIPGFTVRAEARAVQIVWNMGDGAVITCKNPGTEFTARATSVASPTCGHVYSRSSASQPGHVFTIVATTTWTVTWSGGGQSGVITVTRSSRTTASIGELQVVTS